MDERDLRRWSEALAGIARTGLGFTQSLYERERYEEVLHVAADMRVAADELAEQTAITRELDHASQELAHGRASGRGPDLVQEWMDTVGHGTAGYVTPKVAVGAVVGNDAGEILLVRRSDSGVWLYPTGWADVGYSPAEVVVKEVLEETGIECEPVRVIAVLDGMRMGFTRVPMYSIVFHCRAIGGTVTPHPLETDGAGWFALDALPSPLAGVAQWGAQAFAAIRGEEVEVQFDPVRRPIWRGGHDHD